MCFQNAAEQPDQLHRQQHVHRAELGASAVSVRQQDLQYRTRSLLHPALPVHNVSHLYHFHALSIAFFSFLSHFSHYLSVCVTISSRLSSNLAPSPPCFCLGFILYVSSSLNFSVSSSSVGVIYRATHTDAFAHMLLSGLCSPHRCSLSLSMSLVWFPGHLLSKLNISQHLHTHINTQIQE